MVVGQVVGQVVAVGYWVVKVYCCYCFRVRGGFDCYFS